MQTAYISHPLCLKHLNGKHHPECPERIPAIEDQLISSGLFDYLQHHEAQIVTREQLLRVHDGGYLDSVAALTPERGVVQIDGDTAMNPYTFQAALHAAGAVVQAVDMVMAGQVENAFCSIRPPGHHAESAQAMGFCIINNVAVGAAHALAAHGLKRVAIVDFDVHHGNGTEQIFANNPQVMLCSTFQHPFYPHSGADSSNDHIINLPFPARTMGKAYRELVTTQLLPALAAFQPEMLFISAGFDAHRDDDMSMTGLIESDYAWLTNELKRIAEKYAHGRIVSVLEGGYELHALGRSVMVHIKALGEL